MSSVRSDFEPRFGDVGEFQAIEGPIVVMIVGPHLNPALADVREFRTGVILQGTTRYEGRWVGPGDIVPIRVDREWAWLEAHR